MNGPPVVLLRLTHYLGGELRRTFSRWRCWFLIAIGVIEFFIWVGSFPYDDTSSSQPLGIELLALTMGVFLVVLGAEGLLRESHAGLALWFRIFQTLLIVPIVLSWAAQWYVWWGILGVGACILVVAAILIWGITQRKRAMRQLND